MRSTSQSEGRTIPRQPARNDRRVRLVTHKRSSGQQDSESATRGCGNCRAVREGCAHYSDLVIMRIMPSSGLCRVTIDKCWKPWLDRLMTRHNPTAIDSLGKPAVDHPVGTCPDAHSPVWFSREPSLSSQDRHGGTSVWFRPTRDQATERLPHGRPRAEVDPLQGCA